MHTLRFVPKHCAQRPNSYTNIKKKQFVRMDPNKRLQVRCKVNQALFRRSSGNPVHVGLGYFWIPMHQSKKMQIDVDIEPNLRFTYMKCIDKQKGIRP